MYEFKDILCRTAATSQRATPDAVEGSDKPILETSSADSEPDLASRRSTRTQRRRSPCRTRTTRASRSSSRWAAS